MATRSAPILMEEATFCSALNQTLQAYPEVLSAIYTTHYRHVLQVCRRFFRRPEDAEDAAAEVFLKLHTVLDKKDDAYPSAPGYVRWQVGTALINCAGESARSPQPSKERTLALFPTIQDRLLCPRCCEQRRTASSGSS